MVDYPTSNILLADWNYGILGGLPSMGSHRVGHNWSDLAVAACQLPLHFKALSKTRATEATSFLSGPPFPHFHTGMDLNNCWKKKKMKNSPRQISTKTHGWPVAKNGNWVLEGTPRMGSIFQSLTFQTNTATHTGKCPSHTEEGEDKEDHLTGCHYKNLNEADNRKLSTNTPVMVCMGP